MRHWCEFCRDWYPNDHFLPYDTEASPGTSGHRVGAEWGPTGASMELEQAAIELADFLTMSDPVVPGLPRGPGLNLDYYATSEWDEGRRIEARFMAAVKFVRGDG